MTIQSLIPIAYLIAAVTFILGLKGLSGPNTAVQGNRIAAAGMLIAVIATFFANEVQGGVPLIIAGILVGGAGGFVGARMVKMTAMPQMVALFNGAGGGAAALVAILEFARRIEEGSLEFGPTLATLLALIIGAVSFSGSAIAFGKLQGIITPRAFKYAGQQFVTGGVALATVALSIVLLAAAFFGVVNPAPMVLITLITLLSLAFGVALVMPIGGADMPVVISLLNAYTGLAVAMAGFTLGNQLLIVAGTLVGASGTILTRLMSKAMNRSLGNVLFGGFGAVTTAGAAAAAGDDSRTVRSIGPEDAAILLSYAQNVIVVPGYGLAVAQAQHGVRELADLLESRGISVKYAIHPVAGRMPGHMNVLLAEANVPYDKLFDMDQINPEFERADVALVIGANDVTNPAARSNPGSPIYGMPILDVDRAQNIIVIKRSMKPGFAGIDNDLYLDPKTAMLFGDAKDAVGKVVQELKRAA
jgi:H+-translocating NAD(P) transhydrogenase subunit beta